MKHFDKSAFQLVFSCRTLFLQIANNSGYIQVDWKRVEKDVNKAKKQLKKGTHKAGPELNTFVEKVRPQHFVYFLILIG